MIQAKLVRIARGIKAYEMAAKVGYNPQLWYQIEQGLRQPTPDVAKRASTILGESVEELFRPVEDNKTAGEGQNGS